MALVKADSARHPRDDDRQAMIAYEALIYPVFLMIAMLGRFFPGQGLKARPSVFAEAAERTQSIVPWFFVHR